MSKRRGCPSCLAFAIGKVCSWKTRCTMRARCAGNLGAVRGFCAPWTLRCDTAGSPHLSNFGAPQKARCTLGSSVHPSTIFSLKDGREVHRITRGAPSFEKCTEVDGTHQKVRRCTEAPKVCRVWRGVPKSERHIDAHWALRLGVEYRGGWVMPTSGEGARRPRPMRGGGRFRRCP